MHAGRRIRQLLDKIKTAAVNIFIPCIKTQTEPKWNNPFNELKYKFLLAS